MYTNASVLGSRDAGAGFVIPDLKFKIVLYRQGLFYIHSKPYIDCNGLTYNNKMPIEI